MESDSKTKRFIDKAKIVHGEFYDYSQSIYVNKRIKLKIICPVHGEFLTTSRIHLQGHKCKKCYYDDLKLSKQEFLDKCLVVHKNTYDYSQSEYIDSSSDIEILCKKHGIFLQKPRNHIRGQGCQKCAREFQSYSISKNIEFFIENAKNKHGERYDYSKSEYSSCKSKIIVICKDHGEFSIRPDSHISGSGCPTCAAEEKKNTHLWRYSDWVALGNTSKYFESYKIYVIKCWNSEEIFFKIGKTFQDIKRRFKTKQNMPYSWAVEKIFKSNDAKYICELETKLHNINKNNKYLPKIKFGGMYECFSEVIYE